MSKDLISRYKPDGTNGSYYVDIEAMQATITEQQAHINQLTNEKLTLQYKLRGWEEAYEDYLDDHDSRFTPPDES
jgi:hypothetical protein